MTHSLFLKLISMIAPFVASCDYTLPVEFRKMPITTVSKTDVKMTIPMMLKKAQGDNGETALQLLTDNGIKANIHLLARLIKV